MSLGVGSAHAASGGDGSSGDAPLNTTYTPIAAPHGAAQWGNTSASQVSSGSTDTGDSEVHSGTASNFGQGITTSDAVGTNYANQASASSTLGGSQDLYSSVVSTPPHDS
ncbi:hypothetical protein [Streptomyces sp. IMTB 1903]|uniref:hypothetical protein n=1 Tax=Streptomyces sp. IMTB 1903 TaxID=1776680 RepID=UPI0007559B61|nr:hypothetical protein [Streptomyces sp. IMTB 1903]